MDEQKCKSEKKYINVGLLAHVDAGKTTLSEAILYTTKQIRKLGRVDKGDAFLDTDPLEKSRGITIFAKEAVLSLEDTQITLVDTPGHVDFSAEMERTLQILDYAILVISGSDGVQSHTTTLWSLLRKYHIPTFLFVNKMDQPGTNQRVILEELQNRLDSGCTDFSSAKNNDWWESLALADEMVLEKYLETKEVSREDITKLIVAGKIFPCYFGSALQLSGVEELLEGIRKYTIEPPYGEKFGARVYKISRDHQGNRLTHLKITGGMLSVKAVISHQQGEQEKINQIRIYSGGKYETVESVQAGMICAVTGPAQTYPGERLGEESKGQMPTLIPVLNYRMILPEDCGDIPGTLRKLRLLEEESPELHIVWKEELGEIHVQVMGQVQLEVLKSLIEERYQLTVDFDQGAIVYRETIENTVVGVGHYEPLRHYAEVHLLLEPGEMGSGLVLESACSTDNLDLNWQRLILTHLGEREHPGVLMGAAVTDMKITILGGRAHLKHTEGGDFRQATYRALRQGLKKAACLLLEPYYDFRLELPSHLSGRAMSDIQRMSGEFQPPETRGERTILMGTAPVATMRNYMMEVNAYSRGEGQLSCSFGGYRPCHNQEEVLENCDYDSERDVENPTGSVFCSHGAGFTVPWNQVDEYAHVKLSRQVLGQNEDVNEEVSQAVSHEELIIGQDEIEKIMGGIYRVGKSERGKAFKKTKVFHDTSEYRPVKKKSSQEYLLVDGYNIIFAWEDLRELAKKDIGGARDKLMDILCNYQGYKKCQVILVFDAYKVEGGVGEVLEYHNIHVVYTKEAETADQYIERVAHEMGRSYEVTVATSDGLEQVIILGQGCRLLSARELEEEIAYVRSQIREDTQQKRENSRSYLLDYADEKVLSEIKKIRED